jgi:uncharacterized integral membrane protein
MRARVIIPLLAILLVAGFAAQNWSEFQRPVSLLFGFVVADAPLGLIMLGALGLTLVAFLLTTAAQETRSLVENRHHSREMERQRALADKAEASRFTELRHYMDTQLKDLRQRETVAATELEKAMVNSQRELRLQLENSNKLLATRLGELESRIDARLARLGGEPVLTERASLNPLRRERV